jgi:transposase
VVRLLRDLGQEVVIVHPRRLRLIAESTMKTDAIDAEILARVSRFDVALLRPVYQRSEEAQILRTRLRARASLVKSRTALINSVRGSLRSLGYRMAGCPAACFAARWAKLELPEEIGECLGPVVDTIGELTQRLHGLEKQLAVESRSDELMERLQTVPGVGPIMSLAYVGWMDQADRFAKSRDVAACLGLRPKVRTSGGHVKRGPITREGEAEMRRLLVQSAHACLRCRRDSALKQWGEQLVERIGKRKALVAIARKIAVILHRLWVSGERFQAFPSSA